MIPCRTQVWKPSAKAEQLFAQKLLPAFEAHCAKHAHKWNETELLMWCCNQIPFGHSILPDFIIATWQLWWPHLQIESQGIVNHWLVRIVNALCREKVLDIIGAASSGKSYIVAAYGYTLWKLKPHKTSVFLSTTSAEAGESRMWGFVKELHNMDQTKIGKQISSLRLITLDEEVRDEEGVKQRDFKDVVKCVNIKQGQDGNNVIAAICGRKNDRVFWGAQPLASAVLTPTGWTTIGELQVGDDIIARDGTTQKVTHLHPISNQDVYQLEFSDRSIAHSTDDHWWTMQDAQNARPIRTERLSYFIPRFWDHTTPRWSVPKPAPIQFAEVPKPKASPYIVGALIGDGCIRQGLTFYNFTDRDIVEEIKKELPEGYSMVCYRESHGQFQIRGHYGPGVNRNNVITRELKKWGLLGCGSAEKFLPKELLFGSLETRRLLLQGLLDTDGCVLHSTIRYTSISAQLRQDVIHLVRSLGGYARESNYEVVINIEDFVPFRCKRKIARMRPSKFRQRRKAVTSITKLADQMPVRCITVSSEDGLYITNDFVVTHNCDEMDFMDLGVLNARVSLVPNPFSQFVGLNNAPDEGKPMYIDAEPHGPDFPDGWRSVDKDIHEEWPTRTGRCIYFNSDKCPNVLAKDPSKPPFPKLMTAQMRAETIRSAGGLDTPMAWKYIYGFPASVDIPDKVLTHKLLETNACFEVPVWADADQKTLAGLDLGWKEGGDPCAIHFGKVGMDTRAKKILGMEPDAFCLTPSQKKNEAYEVQIAARVIEECRKRGCHHLALDVTGDGGLMLQAIEAQARREKYDLEVVAVSFAGSASDRPVMPGDGRLGRDIFDRKVSELWVSFRLSCINGVVRGLGVHSNSKQQLCARKGTNDDRKRYTVEPKKEMKKRLKRSPDHADATVLLHTLALRHGLSGAEPSALAKPKPRNPREALDRALGGSQGRYEGHGAGGRYGGR